MEEGRRIRLHRNFLGYSELRLIVNTDAHRVVAVHCPFPTLALADQGLFTGWITPGGYLQVQIDKNNPRNGGAALFNNIAVVPEPASVAVLGLGVAALALRRRKK